MVSLSSSSSLARSLFFALALPGLPASAAPAELPPDLDAAYASIEAADAYETCRWLCLPRFAGRFPGTPEYTDLCAQIANTFKAHGLEPGADGSFLQPYPSPVTTVEDASLKLILPTGKGAAKETLELEPGVDFLPLLFTDSGVAEGESSPGHRGRVLVVDDEAPIRTVLKRMLGKEHEVVAVASGEEGKAILAKDTGFDLLLCDMMMARTSGVDLHRWLSEKDPGLAQRTVFITGGTFTPKCREYLDGVDNLKIEKPFDTKTLKKLVADMVALARK